MLVTVGSFALAPALYDVLPPILKYLLQDGTDRW